MRPLSVCLAAVLVLGSLPAGERPAAAATLNAQIDSLAGGFPGGTAIWVSDPSASQPLYTRDADRQIVTASLYKLAVLLEAEHQVDLGRLRYGDTMTIDQEDITTDGSFEGPGTELTIDEALDLMITVSDNGTALHLWRTLGPANINAYLVKSGVSGFHIAVDQDDDNHASARAVGTFLTLLANRKLVSAAASDRMIRRLERQEINDRIPAQLPEGTTVAHKTGNLAGIVHDAGILFTPLGQRILVAMTWDTDDDVATRFIAHLASTVYSALTAPPAVARYGVTTDTQYAELAKPFAFDVSVENAGSEAWTMTGLLRVGLVWELRDTANSVLLRAPQPLPLGQVLPGGSVSVPVVVTAPARPGDAKLVLGLADGNGAALAGRGVATATIPLRIHLPFVADAVVTIPSLLHRREASMIEVDYVAIAPVRADDHYLALGWRIRDNATDRVVAQGVQQLGVMRTYERRGSFFAPLVAPNVRGTYTLEYEIRERGFIAGVTQERQIEIGPRRTYGDEAAPGPTLRRLLIEQDLAPAPTPRARPARTPLPTARVTPAPPLPYGQAPTPRPTSVPRPGVIP